MSCHHSYITIAAVEGDALGADQPVRQIQALCLAGVDGHGLGYRGRGEEESASVLLGVSSEFITRNRLLFYSSTKSDSIGVSIGNGTETDSEFQKT